MPGTTDLQHQVAQAAVTAWEARGPLHLRLYGAVGDLYHADTGDPVPVAVWLADRVPASLQVVGSALQVDHEGITYTPADGDPPLYGVALCDAAGKPLIVWPAHKVHQHRDQLFVPDQEVRVS